MFLADNLSLLSSVNSELWFDLLVKIFFNGLALFIAAKIMDGVEIKSFSRALIVALVLAVLNATLGAYLEENFSIFSIGILSFLADGIVLLVASWFLAGFRIRGLIWAFVLAIVLSFLNGLIIKFL